MKNSIFLPPPPKNTQYNVPFSVIDRILKKAACAVSLILCLSLTACSTSDAEQTSSETQGINQESVTSQSAGESSASTSISTDLQESIISICPNASIYETDGSISVDMTETYENFSVNLIYDCARIIGTSGFSEEYPGVSFSYLTDDLSFFLTISDYQDVSSYTTTLTCSGDNSNQVAAAQLLYDNLFYNHDVGNKQLIEQGKIADKYGVDGGDATADPKPEDDLWFYSSFDKNLPHELSGSSYVVNYRYNLDDTYSYGKSVGNDIITAADHLTSYVNNSRDLLSFNEFLIICFDGDSDTRYGEYKLGETSDGSWGVTHYYFADDNFKNGLESVIGEPESTSQGSSQN